MLLPCTGVSVVKGVAQDATISKGKDPSHSGTTMGKR